MWDDVVMNEDALGGYSMPKYHTVCGELKEDGGHIWQVHKDLPHSGVSSGEFTKSQL